MQNTLNISKNSSQAKQVANMFKGRLVVENYQLQVQK